MKKKYLILVLILATTLCIGIISIPEVDAIDNNNSSTTNNTGYVQSENNEFKVTVVTDLKPRVKFSHVEVMYGDTVDNISNLRDYSKYIVVGKVSNMQPHPSGTGYSYILTVDVQNVIKGEPVSSIKVLQANDSFLSSVGQSYVFFLKYDDETDYYYISGGYQGVMQIKDGLVKIHPTLNYNISTQHKNGLVPLNDLVDRLKK